MFKVIQMAQAIFLALAWKRCAWESLLRWYDERVEASGYSAR